MHAFCLHLRSFIKSKVFHTKSPMPWIIERDLYYKLNQYHNTRQRLLDSVREGEGGMF